MDEPLGALDRELRERMMVELRRIHEEVRVTALYVTHDREEALTLADRVGIMRDGLLEGVGTATELLTSPPSRFIASFFGGHALLPARMVSLGTVLPDGTLQAKVSCLDQTIEVPMHAEDLMAGGEISLVVPAPAISATPLAPGEALSIEARVVDVLDLGDRLRITCSIPALDNHEEGTLLRISGERLGALAGQVVAGCDVRLFADRTKLVAVAGRGAS
jgi:putative spermidine/putrescine transport system ATP-binding protein